MNLQCNGGTDMFPLLVMEMQTGSTNNHISQIFFVLSQNQCIGGELFVAPVPTNGAL